MSVSSLATLASLRLQSQQRADMVNSQFVATYEWNQNISNSYKELYDLLIGAYGNDYSVAAASTFTTDGTSQTFSLPTDFYKLLGVDLQLGSQPSSFVTLKPFNFSARNQFAVPNFQSFYGVTNLRYRLQGSKIWLSPIPSAGQTIQIWYIPEPTSLQFPFVGTVTSGSPTISVSDTSSFAAGMVVYDSAGSIPASTTISSISANTSITLSGNATATTARDLIYCASETVTVDGISGWEDYIIIDAAIKAISKEEGDTSELRNQKAEMKQRLIEMMENRDAGMPATVSDNQYSDIWGPSGFTGGGGY